MFKPVAWPEPKRLICWTRASSTSGRGSSSSDWTVSSFRTDSASRISATTNGRARADHLQKGYETQVWLAASNDDSVKVSGRYFHHQKETRYKTEADDVQLQEEFLGLCEEITEVPFQ